MATGCFAIIYREMDLDMTLFLTTLVILSVPMLRVGRQTLTLAIVPSKTQRRTRQL